MVYVGSNNKFLLWLPRPWWFFSLSALSTFDAHYNNEIMIVFEGVVQCVSKVLPTVCNQTSFYHPMYYLCTVNTVSILNVGIINAFR